MKPTDRQKEFIAELRKVLDENFTDWNGSNDITSPSHYSLIDDSLSNLSEKFDLKKRQIVALTQAIERFYNELFSIK